MSVNLMLKPNEDRFFVEQVKQSEILRYIEMALRVCHPNESVKINISIVDDEDVH